MQLTFRQALGLSQLHSQLETPGRNMKPVMPWVELRMWFLLCVWHYHHWSVCFPWELFAKKDASEVTPPANDVLLQLLNLLVGLH